MTRREADALIREAKTEAAKLAEGRPVTPINFYRRSSELARIVGKSSGLVFVTTTASGHGCNVWL